MTESGELPVARPEGSIVPQSRQSVPLIRYSSPVPWIGAIAISLVLWSLVIWAVVCAVW
jgi:hypothetical protein